ncbi:MAG: putative transporter [Tidjanibacter sp.]|nr:putative transporter [Tidjanibacter sp.]
MNWLGNLFLSSGTAHSIMLLALTIVVGLLLNRIRFGGVKLGITWILFAGIAFSHFGMRLTPEVSQFVKEFGLILFVYSIGLQVGPGFFASFKKGGVKLNLLATAVILLGCITTYLIAKISKTDLATMTGVMSGAVTNTPSLGAAQQTLNDVVGNGSTSDIAVGYAVAYPFGVIGIILSMLMLRAMLRIKLDRENELVADSASNRRQERVNIRVTRREAEDKTLETLRREIGHDFVITRVLRKCGTIEPVTKNTIFAEGDIVRLVDRAADHRTIIEFFGEECNINRHIWEAPAANLVSKRVLVTNPQFNGRHLNDLKIRSIYGVNITRVTRGDVELLATPSMLLQLGDRLTVVGLQENVDKVSSMLGDSLKKLNVPNLMPIFLGIFIGVILGMMPIMIPGMPQPVKLGLAGGPLVVAILLGRFGPSLKLVTFSTVSANMMLREVGISLFLAAVGLGAGETFISTIVAGGYRWILYATIIAIVPLLIVGFIGRKWCKIDYFTLCGMLAGSMTDPPALTYASSLTPSDSASLGYVTVYPLAMFLRIIAAQVMILIALA